MVVTLNRVVITSNEADTCRKCVVPGLIEAGWDDPPHSIAEQRTFTDGRIVVTGNKIKRRKRKRVDYLLRYSRDFPIAVVEAKPEYKLPGDGMQQAKLYTEMLGLKFAYSTNGKGIVEYDCTTGLEQEVDTFPSPKELWTRLRSSEGLDDEVIVDRLLAPSDLSTSTTRYYQEIAINRVVQSILKRDKRILLTMATGTGKTFVAYQICWKLWNVRWNASGEYRRPKILYLADRNILVDDPKDKTFAKFGDALWKIEKGEAKKGRDVYFSTYQSIAEDESRPGLYKEYAPDFFDLIIVDECHRGSAKDESNWREILEYFESAYQLGMTATPQREENRDTYSYFGNPVYQYSLRQGIEDGFLAPYRVHRVVTEYDAEGWRPTPGQIDRYGRNIPEGVYTTKDFERIIALRARTEAIARHLAEFMTETDRFAKTIVFCVDQEHADEMRRALNNLNVDLVKDHQDYVCRVTAEEGDIGRGHLSDFQDLESKTPVILTTSKLLTTGVDVPTCKNIVLARPINSMVEFKQIIGRGTRVREDYGKLYFNILDYTGSATRLFADPDFDGDPVRITEEEIDEQGRTIGGRVEVKAEADDGEDEDIFKGPVIIEGPESQQPRKYYVDGGYVEIVAHMVHELTPDGETLRIVKFTDYTAEKVRTLYTTAEDLRTKWADLEQRAEIIASLEEKGIFFDELAEASGQPDADPFDLICHLAFNAPLLTRRERAEKLRKNKRDFFDRYGPQAREVLEELLQKYSDYGTSQLEMPNALEVPPISDRGNVLEISGFFGGPERLKTAVDQLKTLLYAV